MRYEVVGWRFEAAARGPATNDREVGSLDVTELAQRFAEDLLDWTLSLR